MKKQVLSFLLSLLMAAAVFFAFPSGSKAEGFAAPTYGSVTDPGGAASVAEWRDQFNTRDLFAGWYHFTGEDTNWYSLNLYLNQESASDIYDPDHALCSIELWKKADSSYEKINAMDLNYGIQDLIFHMDKGTEYYVYLGGTEGCGADMRIQVAPPIFPTFQEPSEPPASYQTLDVSAGIAVNAVSPEEIQWIQFTAPETGRYKFSYPDARHAARVDLLNITDRGLGYDSDREVSRDGVFYMDLKEGETGYLACTSFEGTVSYTVSVKKVTATDTYVNKEHTFAVRKETNAASIAVPQAETSVDYLEKMYTDKPFALRVDHVDSADLAALKKMAGIITAGCTTDRQKVEAVTKWVKNNITYDTTVSSYSTAVFTSRRGDCQGMSMLINDFCRVLGIPATYASGWKADLTRWTIDDLYHSYDRHGFAAHGWSMIYFDQKWHMYDVLFGYVDITDPAVMAASGYFFAWVEGIAIVGDGVDPALTGMEDIYERTIAAAWYDDKLVTLKGGRLCNHANAYQIDQDGDVCSSPDSSPSVGWWTFPMEDHYYPTIASFMTYHPYSDEINLKDSFTYDDGRPDPPSGYNYVDGWINGQYLADPDGVLRNISFETIGEQTYFFPQTGQAQILHIPANAYYLHDGQLYIKSGTSGRFLTTVSSQEYMDDPDYTISYEFISTTDEKGNPVDGSSLLHINEDNTMTALRPGYVWYIISVTRKEDSVNMINESVMFHITDTEKPAYSFKNSPVSSGQTKTVKKVSLSKTSYVYNGKVKTPTVQAYATDGSLIPSDCYTVKKSPGRKKVGKYKYTITFKNGYTGKKTVSFTIRPKPTSISSLKKGVKRFTVKWKKVSAEASGYQIRYSTKASMAKATVVTAKKAKTVSKKILRLKKKKKYYVQVRTYKTVSKVNYYSRWSGKKSVVTK